MHCIGWLERFQRADACLRAIVCGANRLRSVERRLALVRVRHHARVCPLPASSLTPFAGPLACGLGGGEPRFLHGARSKAIRQFAAIDSLVTLIFCGLHRHEHAQTRSQPIARRFA